MCDEILKLVIKFKVVKQKCIPKSKQITKYNTVTNNTYAVQKLTSMTDSQVHVGNITSVVLCKTTFAWMTGGSEWRRKLARIPFLDSSVKDKTSMSSLSFLRESVGVHIDMSRNTLPRRLLFWKPEHQNVSSSKLPWADASVGTDERNPSFERKDLCGCDRKTVFSMTIYAVHDVRHVWCKKKEFEQNIWWSCCTLGTSFLIIVSAVSLRIIGRISVDTIAAKEAFFGFGTAGARSGDPTNDAPALAVVMLICCFKPAK